MAKIYLIKARSPHDLTWRFPRVVRFLAESLGMDDALSRLKKADGRPFMPQLVLPYLAALIERYNGRHGTSHTWEIVDETLDSLVIPEDADMAWFTVNSPNAPFTYRASAALKRRGVLTVIGGIHASIAPEEAGRHCHTVVKGEAEGVVDRLLGDFDATGTLAPLYKGGKAASLDALPMPAWPTRFDYAPWVVPVQTSRGCRNGCSFCSTTRFQGARRRHRPVEEIVAEIRHLKDVGQYDTSKVIFFTDNNIVSDSDHRRGVVDTAYARSLFEALEKEDITWVGQGEISVAEDLNLLESMSRSGCRMLLVGFESLSRSSLDEVGKPVNRVEEYARLIERMHFYDIGLIGCFIFGFDSDGPEVFEDTVGFVEKYIDVPQLSILTPMPGTALFRRMERQRRLLHRDWSRYDILNVTFKPARMSVEELERGYRWICRRVYSWRAMVARSWRLAARPVEPSVRRLLFNQRFTFTLAPNIIYRGLSRIGRPVSELGDAEQDLATLHSARAF